MLMWSVIITKLLISTCGLQKLNMWMTRSSLSNSSFQTECYSQLLHVQPPAISPRTMCPLDPLTRRTHCPLPLPIHSLILGHLNSTILPNSYQRRENTATEIWWLFEVS
jgi:hypothetical protein